MKLSENFIAVGAADDEGSTPCVVIVSSYGVTMRMGEHTARKLADDILRNANFLWPVEEKENDSH